MNDVRHVGIVVENLPVMEQFFESMGFRTVHKKTETGRFIDALLGGEAVEVVTCKMCGSKGTVIELLDYLCPKTERSQKKEVNSQGINHMAITVESVDSVYELVCGLGCEIISKPALNDNSTARVFYCRDPEDNLMEIVEVVHEQSQS